MPFWDAIVADIVYKKFEGKREGFLTNTRSKIVQRETFNRVAVEIGLDKLIKYTTRQSSHNSYMCGNAFEALIGSYLSIPWISYMQEVHGRTYHQPVPELRKNITQGSQLQVETDRMESKKNKFCVEFNLIEQSLDSDQNPIFETQITVENIPAGTGKGYSKKESQQEAAHATLTKIKGDPQFIDAIFAAKAEEKNSRNCRIGKYNSYTQRSYSSRRKY